MTGKLAAWLDGELTFEESAEVERHIKDCEECRVRFEAYRRVSDAFVDYCDAYSAAVMGNKAHSKQSRRALAVTLTAAAIVGAVVLLSTQISRRGQLQTPVTSVARTVEHVAVAPQATSPVTVVRQEAEPVISSAQRDGASVRQMHPPTAPAQIQQARWPADEPTLEIAIPGEAIFAPGALPEGMGFTVDVSIAPDGWAQQMQVHPQLAEFERRAN